MNKTEMKQNNCRCILFDKLHLLVEFGQILQLHLFYRVHQCNVSKTLIIQSSKFTKEHKCIMFHFDSWAQKASAIDVSVICSFVGHYSKKRMSGCCHDIGSQLLVLEVNSYVTFFFADSSDVQSLRLIDKWTASIQILPYPTLCLILIIRLSLIESSVCSGQSEVTNKK